MYQRREPGSVTLIHKSEMKTASRRIGRTIVTLSVLFSFLTGCGSKPTGPGVSAKLQYPVLLFNDRRIIVWDDEARLTTSTLASGINYPEFTLIDSGGAQYSVRKVTEFGKTSGWFDMGTSSFHVYLDLKSAGRPDLSKVKELLKKHIAGRAAIGIQEDAGSAVRVVESATSIQELMALCRTSPELR